MNAETALYLANILQVIVPSEKAITYYRFMFILKKLMSKFLSSTRGIEMPKNKICLKSGVKWISEDAEFIMESSSVILFAHSFARYLILPQNQQIFSFAKDILLISITTWSLEAQNTLHRARFTLFIFVSYRHTFDFVTTLYR